MDTFTYTQKYNSEKNREELTFTISDEVFKKYSDTALNQIAKETTLAGFRKGKAPKTNVLKAKFNEVYETAVNLVINAAVNSIDKDLEPRPLDRLEVTNVSFDEKNNLVLILSYIPVPEVKVGDISKVKVTAKEAKKTDAEEIQKEIGNLWFHYAGKNNPELKKEDFSEDKLDEVFFKETDINKDYPEIKDLAGLKEYLENFINKTYEDQAKISYENEIIEKAVEVSTFGKIEALIEKELDKRVENYKNQFARIGMNADEYMQKSNINEEDLRKSWKDQVEKDVKVELLLQEHGKNLAIEPTEEEVQTNIESLDDQTKKAYANNPEYLRSLIKYYFVNQKAYSDILEKAITTEVKKKKK